MLCQTCKKRLATIHLTEIKGSVKHVLHVCESCAEHKGLTMPHLTIEALTAEAGAVVEKLVEKAVAEATEEAATPDLACTECGMTFKEFRRLGRLGCPADYDAFQSVLEPLLSRMHESAAHVGKVPQRASVQVRRQRELRELRGRLAAAVKAEAYEEAVGLRDAIKTLEAPEGEKVSS